MDCWIWVSFIFYATFHLSPHAETCSNTLALSVFLPALVVSIVSTSLITIGNALNRFDQISWLIGYDYFVTLLLRPL